MAVCVSEARVERNLRVPAWQRGALALRPTLVIPGEETEVPSGPGEGSF